MPLDMDVKPPVSTPLDSKPPDEERDSPILNTIPTSASTATSIADSLARMVERRRIEKELDAVKHQALERALRGVGYSGLLPGYNGLSSFPGLTMGPNWLNGEVTEETGGPDSPEPQDLSTAGRDKGGTREASPSAIPASTTPSAPAQPSAQPNWSYEEQFKHLYELDSSPKRKEWLDDWLNFMHRIGKPVTRIPIMAKQVLDLYQLYHLVVAHGGLVEIIHKKLWREITKGLNLPSSITSAAFTLRTQYQKYLYDFECEREGLSKPEDLQAAIDGNRREGRRTTANYSPYSMAPSLVGPGGAGPSGAGDPLGAVSAVSQHAAMAAAYRDQFAALEAQQRSFDARARKSALGALDLGSRASVEPKTPLGLPDPSVNASAPALPSGRLSNSSAGEESGLEDVESGLKPSPKRPRLDSNDNPIASVLGAMSSAHLKMTSSGNNSLIVSMEINGVMYQGVLFASAATGAASRLPSL